jgi:integrase
MLPGTVTAKTVSDYGKVIRTWLTPYLGNVRLTELGPEHVHATMQALEKRGLKPSSRVAAKTVLRRALHQAEEWGRVSRNAAALVRSPRVGPAKIDDALDADEAARVIAAASGDRLEAMAVLALALGLRHGEVLNLRWSDVDLAGATVTIRKAKTAAGHRTIALPRFVVRALRAHQRLQKAERLAAPVWVDEGWVFTSPLGTQLGPRQVLYWWHQLTIRAGVGRRRFHAARHTAATLMLNNGVPLEVVSKTLGHAGLAITADVYAKVRPELQRTAADAMERVLG